MENTMRFSELMERKLTAIVDYNRYFESEAIEGLRLITVEIGKIHLPSGRIVACDPIASLGNAQEECLPFMHTVEPGEYPVTLSILKSGDANSTDQYAAVRIRFSENRPVKWLLALRGNEEITDLQQDGDYFGFAADSGVGCFADVQAREPFILFSNQMVEEGVTLEEGYFADRFRESYEKFPFHQREQGDWLNVPVPGREEVNLLAFQTGFGDGVYPCYWGVDEHDQPAQLVADFLVL